MAKATFDIKDLTTIKIEARRGLHAGVGAADLAVEAVREYVAEARKLAQQRIEAAQESVRSIQLQPRALRSQATTVVGSRVEELSKEAKARRDSVEKRVAELQAEAQRFVTSNVDTATGTYGSLAERGARVVNRFRTETDAVADPGPVSTSTAETRTAKKAPAAKPAAARTRTAATKKTPVKRTVKKASTTKATTSR